MASNDLFKLSQAQQQSLAQMLMFSMREPSVKIEFYRRAKTFVIVLLVAPKDSDKRAVVIRVTDESPLNALVKFFEKWEEKIAELEDDSKGEENVR